VYTVKVPLGKRGSPRFHTDKIPPQNADLLEKQPSVSIVFPIFGTQNSPTVGFVLTLASPVVGGLKGGGGKTAASSLQELLSYCGDIIEGLYRPAPEGLDLSRIPRGHF